MTRFVKERKPYSWLPLLLGFFTSLGVLVGYIFNPNFAYTSQLIQNEKKSEINIGSIGRVEEIIRFIEHSYVDSINSEELTKHAINQVLSQLDPFSSYISAEDLEDYNDQLEGVFKGIGINYILWKDSIRILRVLDGSPAKEAGLNRGDVLLEIDGDPVSGVDIDLDKVREKINKNDGQTIEVVFSDLKSSRVDSVKLIIKDIPISSSRLAHKLNPKTIYIKIERFSSNTFKQFIKSIEALNIDRAAFDLVLDLRDNPGGYLPETIKILSQFFKEKQTLLSYTEGAKRKRKEYKTNGQQYFNFGKIAVLINNNSASGSEIIAGALQDWDKAVIIGQKSFGKGLVQEIHELKNGGAIRLTVARYMTPSGRSIQKEYNLQDSIISSEKGDYKSRVLNRELIGGGGIDPDIYVKSSDHYRPCPNFNFLQFEAFLLDKLPITSPYASFEECMNEFDISEDMYQSFLGYTNANGEDLILGDDCKKTFDFAVRSNIFEYWYSDKEAAIFRNSIDPVVLEAVNAFEYENLHALLSENN